MWVNYLMVCAQLHSKTNKKANKPTSNAEKKWRSTLKDKWLWTVANAVSIDLVNVNWFIAQLVLICNIGKKHFSSFQDTSTAVLANVQNWQLEISQMQRNADSVFCPQSPKQF